MLCIFGLNDENTKKKLLSQDSLTFEDAMKVSIADEAARKETQIFPNSTNKLIMKSSLQKCTKITISSKASESCTILSNTFNIHLYARMKFIRTSNL